ncbi:uncharacterized protein LOC134853721 [Symsagittifera roscoffensis]|uniref:uncharacterized protein LOC134853721 n=1 Tax=Symsagittifera roscoffensis TaxID=84072 RepID=UPI00307BBC30
MPIKVSHTKPSTRSAEREVDEIIRRLEYSRNSGTLKDSENISLRNSSLRNTRQTSKGLTPFDFSTQVGSRRRSRSNERDIMTSTGVGSEVPPLGRTMAMHKPVPTFEDSVYHNDFKNIDAQVLKDIALKNSRYMSNYGGCFNVTDRRNHPGGGLVKNVTNVHGKQTSYITTYPPAPVPRERIREELVRYSAPTFTSDVLGQQGATFMQPGESSYMTQFRNYSQIKNLDRAKPLSINKSMTRNCPAPGGTCNILTHDGQVMRIFENKSQSAPSHPFDTRKSNLDVRWSVLNNSKEDVSSVSRKEIERLNELWPVNKTSSKECSYQETVTEAATDKYRRLQHNSVRDYQSNRSSGWRWASDDKLEK